MLTFNIDDYELVDVAVGEPDGIAISEESYSTFEQVLEGIRHLPPKAVKVPVRKLSVNGRVVNDRMEKYLATPAESSSMLKAALDSPRTYYIRRQHLLDEVEGDHFTFGTFAHAAILEPSLFSKVDVLPNAGRNSGDGCSELIEFFEAKMGRLPSIDMREWPMAKKKRRIEELEAEAAANGYSFIKPSQMKAIQVLRGELRDYGGGIIERIMPYVQTETSMYYTDPATGLEVKIRPDGLLLEENFGFNGILSVKTTSAKSLRGFFADAAKYRYELAEGMYLDVAEQVTGRPFTATLMLMAQSVEPYQVALLFWSAEDLEVGKMKYRKALDTVERCRVNNQWRGFDADEPIENLGLIRAKLPSYIRNEILNDKDND